MAVGDAHVFPGFLTQVLTQRFFPKPRTTFLTCFCRGERRIYAGKKSRLNPGSNSQSPGHESDTLTTEPPGRVWKFEAFADEKNVTQNLKFCLGWVENSIERRRKMLVTSTIFSLNVFNRLLSSGC